MSEISVIKLPNNTSYDIKDVNGRKQAFLQWGGKHFSANYSPVDAGLISQLGGNRFAFIKPNSITVEYSRNGGTSWTDYGSSDAAKVGIFSGLTYGHVIGKSTNTDGNRADNNCLLRFTINLRTAPVYTGLIKFAIYCSTVGSSGCYVTIDKGTTANNTTTWDNVVDKVDIAGWGGWNIINIPYTTFGHETYNQFIRFTFGATGPAPTKYEGLQISQIQAFGGFGWTTPSNMAKNQHLYSYDANKNATFPANVSATKINNYTLAAACAKEVDTSIASNSTSENLPTSKAVANLVSSAIAASDAMIFKGTIGTGGTVTALPTTYKTGWTYRVVTAGTYAGNVCEVGDLIIALVDRSGSGNVNADWTVAQTNIEGAITKAGGTVNGALTIDNQLSANSAEIGDLVVTGDAVFTNDLRGNLIGTVNGNSPIKGGSNATSAVTITATTTDVYSMTSAGSVTAGTATTPAKIDTSKFSGGSFTRGSFSGGSLTMAVDSTDSKQLNITFTAATHAADSFTPASLASGFYTAGTKGTPTAVTLPGRSSAIKAWTGYSKATAAAQTFTGTPC